MDGGGDVVGGAVAGGAVVGAAVGIDPDEHAASAIVSSASGPAIRNSNDRLSIGRPLLVSRHPGAA